MRLVRHVSGLFAFLFLLAAPLPADVWLTLNPVSPDSHSWITATVLPTWCSVQTPKVVVSGTHISITVESNGGVCIATFVPVPVDANIGVLPAGVYDVDLHGSGARQTNTTLTVRGIDPLRIAPFGGPTAGGMKVVVWNRTQTPGAYATSVSFGGVPATIVGRGYDSAIVVAPPHAAGDVDITYTATDLYSTPPQSTTYTAAAGFRYYDSGAVTPDPFVFEPILFPVAFEGPGAYGSSWTTESDLYVEAAASFWRPPCATCPPVVGDWIGGSLLHLDLLSRASGRVIYVDRGTSDLVSAASRIRDTSRESDRSGVEIPVVRERDFRSTIVLPNIPTGTNLRAMLRVWSTASSGFADVSAGDDWVPVRLSPADGLGFGSLDLTPSLQKVAPQHRMMLRVYESIPLNRYWAMVSITNNETQEVTIVTPR